MATRKSATVDEFLNALEHARKDEVEYLRKVILSSSSKISERVKWNAPSFCFDGEDRVTMRLQPKDRVDLIFHRGAKPKDTRGFHFDDPTGLLDFKAPDRAVICFANLSDIKAKKKPLSELVRRWMTT